VRENPVFKIVSKILFGPIIIYGLYVQFHGDYGPGGGFQAGVIVAAAFILYSIIFIAIVIIGGAGTVLGPLYGAFFFTTLPGIIQAVLHATGLSDTGFFLNAGEIERIVFGFFIIFFLIFEPRGLWGIWFRLRNYFKAWPFSY